VKRGIYFAVTMVLMMAHTLLSLASAEEIRYADVVRDHKLAFPQDHGAHPNFRTEWWYVTGHVETSSGTPLGFQVTFFRSRTGVGEYSKSKFAPQQILFAHAAIADARHGKLHHDEKIARAGFGNHAKVGAMDIALNKWTMRMNENVISTRVSSKDFSLDLSLTPSQAPILQGENGYSQKGSNPKQASYYVSFAQVNVTGKIIIDGKPETVTGKAWFDHEWSSEIMAADVSGWDWLGANLDDGGALMAFRMRGANGKAIWAGGTRVMPDGIVIKMSPQQIVFTPFETWRSPRTSTTYPVAMRVDVANESFELKPWMNDQELDSSRSTGIIYWEGAADLIQNKQRVGRGYLELTGYAKKLRF
jgi:predicted secreted hydrolase